MLMKGLSPRPSRNRDAHYDYMDTKYEQEQERQRLDSSPSLADEYDALEDERALSSGKQLLDFTSTQAQ